MKMLSMNGNVATGEEEEEELVSVPVDVRLVPTCRWSLGKRRPLHQPTRNRKCSQQSLSHPSKIPQQFFKF